MTEQLLCILLPKSRGIVCLHLSSCHLTLQLTIPLELTVWSKETKKLKRAFPWWLGCNNTTAKLNHFSFLLSASLPAYQLLFFSLFSHPNSSPNLVSRKLANLIWLVFCPWGLGKISNCVRYQHHWIQEEHVQSLCPHMLTGLIDDMTSLLCSSRGPSWQSVTLYPCTFNIKASYWKGFVCNVLCECIG